MKPIPGLPKGLGRIRPPGPEELLGISRAVVGGFGRVAGSVVEVVAWEVADWTAEPSRRHLRSLRSPSAWRQPVPAVATGTVATVVVVSFELRRRGRRKAHTRLVLRSVRSAVRR